DTRTFEGATSYQNGSFVTYPLEGSTRLNSVRAYAEDPASGTIFAGTHARGLYRLEGDRFVPVDEAPGLRSEHLPCLLADQDGTLGIGAEGAGIACLRHGRLTRISEEQGLPARAIGSIVDDGLDNLWLGSNRGILRVPRRELEDVIAGRKSVLTAQ